MPTGENVKVAVRVRPFSNREKGRNAKLIVAMDGPRTLLQDPTNSKSQPRTFTFDYSYWSHNGSRQREDGYLEKAQAKYVDQIQVFKDLGMGMLSNAWDGYNCSVFAYGQTSSGKSYSIMGHGANKGLVPRLCEQLFKDIDQRKEKGITYQVNFSMLEIYNEQPRDLLDKKKTPPGGLKVKESPERGFYVEGVTVVPVGTFQDIQLRMNEGNRQRTIASTKMNETSSRAHTIVSLQFAQNDIKRKTTKLSSIKLVDLAGSERAKQTESTGDRFEEAKNINKSLMTLGSVIKALCDKSKGIQSTHIPYRDSVLTKLLKNTLGGNSKTVMLAAISPDAENYDQTLSTLKYADRAKSIKTEARVNQQATNKLIKELIAEKEKLLRELENAKSSSRQGYKDEDIQKLREEQQQEINRYKEQMDDMESAWKKRLSAARTEMDDIIDSQRHHEEEEKLIPHMSNINEDPALMGKLVHLARPGESQIGNGKDGTNPEIILNGPRIGKQHARVVNRDGQVYLQPLNGLVLHNGVELQKDVLLQHQDRLRFGSNNLFVFNHPLEAARLKQRGKTLREITYEYAQDEIAKHSGLNFTDEHSLLREEVMTIMQLVQDANAMAEDLSKPVEFSVLLVSAEARGLENGRTEVYVKVCDLETGNEYMWDRKRFLNRQVHMQQMYQEAEETGQVIPVEKEKDPFWEPADTDVIIGVVSVPLNYLSHMLDFQEEPLTIIDYRARASGFIKVDLLPCDERGSEEVELCVEDPMDLVNKPLAFKIKIQQVMNLPERFEKSWCQYRFYKDSEYTKTDVCFGRNPEYNLTKLFRFRKEQVDHKFVDYLREKSLPIEIWGQQGSQLAANTLPRHKREERVQNELQDLKTKAEILQKKLDTIQHLVQQKSINPITAIEKIRKLFDEE